MIWFKKKSKIFMPDIYAQQHCERVKAGMQDEKSMERRWNAEMAPFRPQNALENGILLWTARLFFLIVSLPSQTKGDLRDKDYHISHSRYAMLDFCIYSFFDLRRTFIAVLRRGVVEKIDDAYFEYLVKYFIKYFAFSEHEINNIIDNRLERYEEIMRTPQVDIDDAMIFSACDFLLNDFTNSPLEKPTVIISADKRFHLYTELSGFIHAEYSLLQSRLKQLPSNCFLD